MKNIGHKIYLLILYIIAFHRCLLIFTPIYNIAMNESHANYGIILELGSYKIDKKFAYMLE